MPVNVWVTVVIGMLFSFSREALAVEYSAESIESRVVDAQSQSPIDGVIVVAHWQLEGGLEGGNVLGQMKVLESVTDSTGLFKFPAWGPVPIPKGLTSNARLKDLDPELILFKPGYKFAHMQNARTLEQTRGYAPYVRTSDWNHKTITMIPMPDDIEEMAKDLWGLDSFIGFATHRYSPCAWRSMPKMIEAAQRARNQIDTKVRSQLGRSIYQYLLTNNEYFMKLGCGSPKEIFREAVK